MANVSLARGLRLNDAGLAYARMLARYLSHNELPEHFGSEGRFERNVKSVQAGIWKMHIRLLGESGWLKSMRQYDRKSDNFLIYAQHWDCRDFYQIVAILSPDAHATVDSILPALIDHVEDEFQSLNERELKELLNVSS